MSEHEDITVTQAATGSTGIWAYTIYDHPSDYPEKFVLRAWLVENGVVSAYEPVGLADSLEDARALVPNGRRKIGRLRDDDPAIVESWI
ncbi:hypothetical protein SEA_JEFE_89 [Microbacterium phage Jefe]|uniref:Uncharacterized protein n=3 Tax=Caudoviricetes TaxID=2731619 RepID=A0A2U8UQ35_9CAUD|nr:hypothetical protein HOT30_gp89 [Microbacterium phage Paschalis]AWN05581.1 hypothetical protein SEA_PASCHALIS_88 [Microbacterium phage Paschalis]QTF81604.1 hypothetical protein SEA_PULCHRA_89 [Microbacterium phage Pulchra]WBF79237.1 hypothetical protein SEA_JEFE_89 [Microbacterium phage Jefe]